MGPRMAEAPITGPKTPNARGSCSRDSAPSRIPMPWGISSAPKLPCTSCPAMSMAGSTDRPHQTDADNEDQARVG